MVDVQNVTDVLSATFSGAADNLVTNTAEVLPGFIAAIIVFLIGWIVAVIISRVIGGVLKAIKLEMFLKDHKVEDALGSVKISDVLVKIVKYYIILIFLQAAASLVTLGTVSAFLTAVLIYAPVLIAAVLVVLAAVILGEYIKESILELKSKSPMVQLFARATKWVVIYVGVTMALATAGFDTTLISNIFLIILQALVYGIALAVGIAFGLGGQKDAQELVGKSRKMLKF
jgi:uncharacterized membrane protein